VPEPRVARDVAEAVRWVASLSAHVTVDEIVIRPRARRSTPYEVHRVKSS